MASLKEDVAVFKSKYGSAFWIGVLAVVGLIMITINSYARAIWVLLAPIPEVGVETVCEKQDITSADDYYWKFVVVTSVQYFFLAAMQTFFIVQKGLILCNWRYNCAMNAWTGFRHYVNHVLSSQGVVFMLLFSLNVTSYPLGGFFLCSPDVILVDSLGAKLSTLSVILIGATVVAVLCALESGMGRKELRRVLAGGEEQKKELLSAWSLLDMAWVLRIGDTVTFLATWTVINSVFLDHGGYLIMLNVFFFGLGLLPLQNSMQHYDIGTPKETQQVIFLPAIFLGAPSLRLSPPKSFFSARTDLIVLYTLRTVGIAILLFYLDPSHSTPRVSMLMTIARIGALWQCLFQLVYFVRWFIDHRSGYTHSRTQLEVSPHGTSVLSSPRKTICLRPSLFRSTGPPSPTLSVCSSWWCLSWGLLYRRGRVIPQEGSD